MLNNISRKVDSDPEDIHSRVDLILAKARTNGVNAYLEPLYDLDDWVKAPLAIKHLAIEEVARRLGPNFKCIGCRYWSCDVFHSIGKLPQRTPVFYLATFKHIYSEMQLNLIPGRKQYDVRYYFSEKQSLKPLLVGRWPLTYDQWQLIAIDTHRFRASATGPDHPVRSLQSHEFVDGFRAPLIQEYLHYRRGDVEETDYYWGSYDILDSSHTWWQGNSLDVARGHLCTTPPSEHDQLQKWNAFGLVDLYGNVHEHVLFPRGSDGRYGGCYRSNAMLECQATNHYEVCTGIRVVRDIPNI